VLEESGVLTRLVRAELARRLGPVGEGLEVERVRLRWFEPGVVVEGVTLRGSGSSSEEVEDSSSRPFLRLDSVHLTIHGDLNPRKPLQRLRIDGGRLRVSDELFASFDRHAAWRQTQESDGSGLLDLEPPRFVLTDFEVELELPDGDTVDLGSVALVAEPGPNQDYRVIGELTPSLAGAVPEAVPIHIEGAQNREGALVRASVRDLPLETQSFSIPPYLGSLPVERFRGALTLFTETRVTWGAHSEVHSEVRASLTEARLLPRAEDPPITDLGIELDATFDYASGGRLWDRDAWSARTRLRGDWNGGPLLAFGEFGRGVPGEDWARIWGRMPELALETSTLEASRLAELGQKTWDAFAPAGFVDASFDLTLPPTTADRKAPRWNPHVALHIRHTGRSSITYHGWVDITGKRNGFPVPCSEIHGDLLLSLVKEASRPLQLGLVDVRGDHGSGPIFASGLLSSPPRESGYEDIELDLELRCPSMDIGEVLRTGLDASRGTRDIWPTYSPEGGTVSAAWRFRQNPWRGGFTAYGEIGVHDATMTWSELPVPLHGVSGRLTFAWADHAIPVVGDPRRRFQRPFGMTYQLSNVSEEDGFQRAEAEAFGIARETSLDVDVIDGADIPEDWIQDFRLRIPNLLLRGADWEVLATSFPEVAAQVSELGAKGGVEVHFQGRQSAPDSPYLSEVEASPNLAEVTPIHFPRRTQDLTGRILVRMNEGDGDDVDTRVCFAVSGSWPQGVELAIRGELPPAGQGWVEVYGAGVDPTNTAFKGALAAVLSEGDRSVGDGLDTSGLSIGGLLDFAATAELDMSVDEPASNAYRVFLRGNEFENESLRLEGLRGVLEQSEDVLRSPRIEATLAGHPLVLQDVLLVRLEDSRGLPEADPFLHRPGFWSDPRGFALQAELHSNDLPVDEEHLKSLLDEETLALLRESAVWRGELDVHGAQVIFTAEEDGEGKVAIRGPVEPHDLFMRLGLPLHVSRALLNIEELVFEQGVVRGWGEIEGLDALIAGRELSDASMILGYVDGRLTVDNLTGAFEGGRLESLGGPGTGSRKAVGIDLASPYRFDVAIRLEDVRLDRLLRGVFPSPIADQGVVDLGFQVSGTPGEVLGLSGDGWVRLEEGRLWSIPVMRELFHLLGFDQTAVFDRLRARFQLRDGRIETPKIEIKSKIVNLVGDGRMDLDGTLSYDLDLTYSLIDRFAVLNRFVYWLNNTLWRVAVRGDMARPQVRMRSSLLEILQRFENPPRALPLPEFAPLPPRF